MYSNNQTQIRTGLVNYIGAMITSSKFQDEKATKQIVVAALLEEAMNLMKDNDGYFDMYICKPALRLTASIIKQRVGLMQSINSKTNVINKQIKSYENITNELVKIIENIRL